MSIKSIKKGAILVSRPSLSQNIFNRSVVLITDYSEDGAMGFILNKPINLTSDSLEEYINKNQHIYTGGPVAKESLFYFHKRPDLIRDSIHIVDDIYWAGEFEDVRYCINNKLITANELKFYLGYCGWHKLQLEEEIACKEWDLVNFNSINIFEEQNNQLWVNLMKKIGGENLIWLNTPADPSMN